MPHKTAKNAPHSNELNLHDRIFKWLHIEKISGTKSLTIKVAQHEGETVFKDEYRQSPIYTAVSQKQNGLNLTLKYKTSAEVIALAENKTENFDALKLSPIAGYRLIALKEGNVVLETKNYHELDRVGAEIGLFDLQSIFKEASQGFARNYLIANQLDTKKIDTILLQGNGHLEMPFINILKKAFVEEKRNETRGILSAQIEAARNKTGTKDIIDLAELSKNIQDYDKYTEPNGYIYVKPDEKGIYRFLPTYMQNHDVK